MERQAVVRALQLQTPDERDPDNLTVGGSQDPQQHRGYHHPAWLPCHNDKSR